MALFFTTKEFSPSELAKVLSEEFGHKVTPSVIRKWDNMIFDQISDKKRQKATARNYNYEDLLTFNAIATLRNLGYKIDDITTILKHGKMLASGGKNCPVRDIVLNVGSKKIFIEVKNQIEKQKMGFNAFEEFLARMKFEE